MLLKAIQHCIHRQHNLSLPSASLDLASVETNTDSLLGFFTHPHMPGGTGQRDKYSPSKKRQEVLNVSNKIE